MSMRFTFPVLVTVSLFAGCGGGSSNDPSDSSQQTQSSSQQASSSVAETSSSVDQQNTSSSMPSSVANSSAFSSSVDSSSEHVSSSSGGVGDIARGRDFYDDQCVDCHGPAGEGARFGAINADCSSTDCSDTNILTVYLSASMPLGTPNDCDETCSADVAAFMQAGFPREGDAPAYSGVEFSCNDQTVPETVAWQRLSKTQYQNALRSVVADLTGSQGEAVGITDGLWQLMEDLPDEVRPQVDKDLHGTYRRLNQTVGLSHVEAWFDIAVQVAAELTYHHRIERTVPCYGSDDVSACVASTIERAGRLILRRPVNSDDQSFYSAYYRSNEHDSSAYADLFTALLNAPEFLYHVYHGNDSSGDAVALAPHELANKLSFHLLDSPPDAQLRAAADDGSILIDAIYSQHVQRLLVSDSAQETTRNFYREWLKLENLEPLNQYNGAANFRTFANGFEPDWDTHLGFMDEVLGLLDYGTWQQDWQVGDLLNSQLILPNTPDLAAIYGVSESQTPVLAPDSSRPGLFTRPAFLATAGPNTRPIMKGVFLRHTVLCDDIPAPPDNATDDLPPLDPALSTRERVEAITERPDTACAFCHESLINGLGYATENYDALGRLRSTERVIDNHGQVLAEVMVDTSGVPQVTNGDFTTTADAGELMAVIADSGKVEACVARHYFRYTFGRFEDVQDDACVLETMRQGLQQGSLQDLIIHTVESPAFKTRTFVSGGVQ
jgi:hypothetical protein